MHFGIEEVQIGGIGRIRVDDGGVMADHRSDTAQTFDVPAGDEYFGPFRDELLGDD
jgi:hypothetical protein